MIKTYKRLIRLPTFEERFEFLRIGGSVGAETFGTHRYLNQDFYIRDEWKKIRRDVIVRDNGNDLGVEGREIIGSIYVHHIIPITIDNLINGDDCIFDMNNLISTSFDTHQAIHYGRSLPMPPVVIERTPGDTKLW